MLNFIRWIEGKRNIKDGPGQMMLWNDKGEPTVPQPEPNPEAPPTTAGMLSMGQCAKYLQVAPRTVMKWVDSKRLPATLDEKKDRWVRPADLVRFMQENGLADPPAELVAMANPERIVTPGAGKAKKSAILQQYEELKSRHPGMIILFRKGDFYELFYEDAERVANLLKLPITRRQDGASTVSMTGFPHKDLEGHLRKMLASKLRVAIADEVK